MKIVSMRAAGGSHGVRTVLGLVQGDLIFDVSALTRTFDFVELLSVAGARHLALNRWLEEIAREVESGQPLARYSQLERPAQETGDVVAVDSLPAYPA